jgi:hypothetical protein
VEYPTVVENLVVVGFFVDNEKRCILVVCGRRRSALLHDGTVMAMVDAMAIIMMTFLAIPRLVLILLRSFFIFRKALLLQ